MFVGVEDFYYVKVDSGCGFLLPGERVFYLTSDCRTCCKYCWASLEFLSCFTFFF